MCLNLFHGDENTCGNTTSGGTDSIMVAIKAYRDWGREKGITKPNLVLPRTAHPAFEKVRGQWTLCQATLGAELMISFLFDLCFFLSHSSRVANICVLR